FMREGCTKQRHDAITHYLVYCALEAVHGIHHPLEHGIKDLTRLLGVTIGEQPHRPLQIGEQHRDLLALALECRLGGEDLLGEVLGRVRLRSSEAGLRTGAKRDGLPALLTEFSASGQLALTLGTDGRQARSALRTEPSLR